MTEIVSWSCNEMQAKVIGIDAPCRWSADDRARPAKRQLISEGIWCFSSPTRQMAINHPRNHFGWMLNNESLFYELEKTHRFAVHYLYPKNSNYASKPFLAVHVTTIELLMSEAEKSYLIVKISVVSESDFVYTCQVTDLKLLFSNLKQKQSIF